MSLKQLRLEKHKKFIQQSAFVLLRKKIAKNIRLKTFMIDGSAACVGKENFTWIPM